MNIIAEFVENIVASVNEDGNPELWIERVTKKYTWLFPQTQKYSPSILTL